MKDPSRKNAELIEEISVLKQRIKELEQSALALQRAEEALQASEERYRSLASSVDSMYLVDKDCRYLLMNEQCRRRFGVPLKQIIGRRYHDFYSEENSQKFAKTVEEVFKTGKAIQMEHLSERDKCFFLRTFSPAMDQGGKLIAAVTIVSKDITERKQAEEALRESEERYRTILENIEDCYFEVDIAGNLTFFNDSLCKLNGYSRAEMMGVNYRQYTDKENSQILYQAYNKVFRTGEPAKGVDYEIIRKDGEKRYVESSVSLIRNISGQPIGFRGIIRNTTERKRAEEALRESEEKYRFIAENTVDVISIVDMNLRFTYVSPSVSRTRGFTAEEAVKHTLDQVLTPESMQYALAVFAEEMVLEATGTANPDRIRILELEEYKKNGSLVWVEVTMSYLRDMNGKPIGILQVSRDITERKQAEEEREKLIIELRDALSKIKTLSGMLPICSSCKKIRDDRGYWNQIESYIKRHSEAEFSHRICPECAKTLYPEHYKKMYPEYDE